jgi:hypothetical protein
MNRKLETAERQIPTNHESLAQSSDFCSKEASARCNSGAMHRNQRKGGFFASLEEQAPAETVQHRSRSPSPSFRPAPAPAAGAGAGAGAAASSEATESKKGGRRSPSPSASRSPKASPKSSPRSSPAKKAVPIGVFVEQWFGAANAGDVDGLELAWSELEGKRDIDFQNESKQSALACAATRGKLDAVKWLLTKGAKAGAQLPFSCAVRRASFCCCVVVTVYGSAGARAYDRCGAHGSLGRLRTRG